jgi:hypothetical protein
MRLYEITTRPHFDGFKQVFGWAGNEQQLRELFAKDYPTLTIDRVRDVFATDRPGFVGEPINQRLPPVSPPVQPPAPEQDESDQEEIDGDV